MNRPLARSAVLLTTALALAACTSPPTQPEAVIKEATGTKPQPVDAPKPPPTTTATNTKPIPPVTVGGGEVFNPLDKFSIYFDLDQYTVDDAQIPLVRRHADYIKKNPNQRVSVQGNTDERGSREYNLSLGQKRAEAVKKLLVTEGAKESQIEAVSLGEEKPKNPGRDETAWKENRRSDITYTK